MPPANSATVRGSGLADRTLRLERRPMNRVHRHGRCTLRVSTQGVPRVRGDETTRRPRFATNDQRDQLPRAEEPIAGVAKSGEDVSLRIELPVE